MEAGILSIEDGIEEIDSLVEENIKSSNFLKQTAQEIFNTMKRPYLRIIGIEEGEKFQLKFTENICNKIIDENFLNIKKDMSIKVEEAYRTLSKLDKETNQKHQTNKPK